MHVRMNVCVIDVIDLQDGARRQFVVHDEANYAKVLTGNKATSPLAAVGCVADLFRLLRDEQWAVVNATTLVTAPSRQTKPEERPLRKGDRVAVTRAEENKYYSVARHVGQTGSVVSAPADRADSDADPWVTVVLDGGETDAFRPDELKHA